MCNKVARRLRCLQVSQRPGLYLQSQPGISLPLALQVCSSAVGVERSSVRDEVYALRILLDGRAPVLLEVGPIASSLAELCIAGQAAETETVSIHEC